MTSVSFQNTATEANLTVSSARLYQQYGNLASKLGFMPSEEFIAHQKAMAEAAAANPPPEFETEQERRDHIDNMLGQRPLADGVVARELDADGVFAIGLAPEDVADNAPGICYFHGGGYRIGSAKAWQPFGSHLAAAGSCHVLLVDYRLAPENVFPAALDDAVTAYSWLVGNVPSERIVLAGDSAGGGLAPALYLAARDRGLPLPAGCACLSPWSDLTNSGESFSANAGTDMLFSKEAADEAAASYLGSEDPRKPYASPVFGDWQGLGPLLIHAGSIEVLLDDAAALANAARRAGADVRHRVFDGMPHVWHHAYPAFPEAVEAVEEIAAFVNEVTS